MCKPGWLPTQGNLLAQPAEFWGNRQAPLTPSVFDYYSHFVDEKIDFNCLVTSEIKNGSRYFKTDIYQAVSLISDMYVICFLAHLFFNKKLAK